MLAGGKGKRMGGEISKQYMLLDEKPVLYYSLKAFEPYVDEFVLVAAAGEEEYCRREIVDAYGIGKVSAIVTGGAERYLSVNEGLKAISAKTAQYEKNINMNDNKLNKSGQHYIDASEKDYVLIHDGARPFITGEAISRIIDKVKECDACIAAVPSKDTVKIGNDRGEVCSTPDRRNVWNVQTPQAFELNSITEAYAKAVASDRQDITDDSMVMENFGDHTVHFAMGEYDNIKLTTPEDIVYGRAILQARK